MAFLLGLAALIGCAYFTRDTLHFKHDGLVAAGTVVDERGQHEISVGNRGINYSSTYSPVVEFTPEEGKPLRFRTKTWTSGHEKVGSTVTVLYFRDDPGGAHLDRFFDNWGASLILAVLGTFLILAAFGVVDDSGTSSDDSRRWSFSWFD